MKNLKLSPVLFVIVILSFFLPFLNISCGGSQVYSFSGFKTAFGTTVTQDQGLGYSRSEKVDGDGVAVAVFITAVLGLLLSFLKTNSGKIINTIISGAGSVLIIIFPIESSSRISKEAPSYVQISYGAGYYLALIFFILALAFNIYVIYSNKKVIAAEGSMS